MTIFTCADNFEAMMTCVYDAWSARLGHSNVRLETEPILQTELFCEYIHIDADPEKVTKIVQAIQQKISFTAYQTVFSAAMSFRENKLDCIYRFLVLGFHYGASVLNMLQEPAVINIFELNRKVNNEAHFFREFARFAAIGDNSLVCHIEPKCNVLTFIGPHFADRMPSENWIIIDDARHIAIVQPANEDFYLTSLSEEEFDTFLQSKQQPDEFIDLWKGFFRSITIKERESHRRQRTMMPLWYRKNVVEFEPLAEKQARV